MESKIILQFQEILYDRSWEKSKKLPFFKQTQAKTALFTSETKNSGVQKGRNKSGIPALQKRCIDESYPKHMKVTPVDGIFENIVLFFEKIVLYFPHHIGLFHL